MTQYKFDRKYELIINNPIDLSRPEVDYKDAPLEDDAVVFKGSDEYTSIFTKVVTITDLHMEADIKGSAKTSGTKGNMSEIKIYNLAPSTRAIVEQVNNYLVLNAGYESEEGYLPMIFAGQVSSCYTKRDGSDLVTHLFCNDGYTPKRSVRISFSVPRGYTYQEVFDRLAGIWRDNGVSIGNLTLDQSPTRAPVVTQPPTEAYLNKAYNFTGFLKDAMDDVCTQFNLNWQIVDNSLYIHPKYYANMVEEVSINYDNILSIEDSQDGESLTSNSTDAKGLELKLLLDGRIKTVKRLTIKDGDKAGTYRVDDVYHKLSYEGEEWYTIVKCSNTGE